MNRQFIVRLLVAMALLIPSLARTARCAEAAALGAHAESSPSSPPLATDDPETPGRDGYEINFISSCDRAKADRSCGMGIDAAFGLGERAQLRVSKMRLWERVAGEQHLNGVGPTDVGVKYRFYEDAQWRIATFPSLDVDDGTRRRLVSGTPVEREGRSLYLPLIVARAVATPAGDITVVGNVAYRFNLERSANDSSFVALALGKAVNETSRVMGEAATQCSSGWRNCGSEVRAGFVRKLTNVLSGRFEASLFGSVGIGRDSDGVVHRTMLAGISIARTPE